MHKNQGKLFENIATFLLTLKGYRILAKNYRTKLGEIDIIATKHNILIAVEVKKRQNLELGLYAIQHRQKLRIQNSLLLYTKIHPKFQSSKIRFDAFIFAKWKLPKHIKNAWY